MATQTNALPTGAIPVMNTPTAAERRREPRFGAEGEVGVIFCEGAEEREMVAKLMDFSLHGLRLRLPREIIEGTHVRVFFSWGEVDTQVVRSSEVPGGFDVGLQLF
jgi:hypothetical protein